MKAKEKNPMLTHPLRSCKPHVAWVELTQRALCTNTCCTCSFNPGWLNGSLELPLRLSGAPCLPPAACACAAAQSRTTRSQGPGQGRTGSALRWPPRWMNAIWEHGVAGFTDGLLRTTDSTCSSSDRRHFASAVGTSYLDSSDRLKRSKHVSPVHSQRWPFQMSAVLLIMILSTGLGFLWTNGSGRTPPSRASSQQPPAAPHTWLGSNLC